MKIVAEFVWSQLKQNTAVHKLRKYPGKCNTYLTNNEMIMKRAE